MACDAKSNVAGGHGQRPWELITLPCINSPVKEVAKVQSQEGINICLLMNPLLCGGYIGTYPPGKHYLCRQTASSELPQRTPGCCAQHSCSHSRCVLESHCLPGHPCLGDLEGGWMGWQEHWPRSQPPVLLSCAALSQPLCSLRLCCLSRTRAPVFMIGRYYSL